MIISLLSGLADDQIKKGNYIQQRILAKDIFWGLHQNFLN
jgi:hypothetical protein